MSGRVSARDWCSAGLELLRDEGLEGLTVDRLCAALRKTKGSFYHHFSDLEGYQAALLASWEEALTEEPIRVAAGEAEPRRRGERLDEAVRGLDHRLDLAVRAWALRDPRARRAMARVDRRRVAYLTELARLRGARRPGLAAQLEYAAFVGAQQLGLFEAPERAARLAEALRGALEGLEARPAARGAAP